MAAYFFGITDKGNRREKNEDTFIAREMAGNGFVLACVIDGVGGYNGGEVAAEIASTVIVDQLQNIQGEITEAIQLAVITANEKIQFARNRNDNNANMACVLTCAVIDIKNNKLYYAHVGDTRLYLLRDGRLVKISKDHSAIGFLEESGRISEEEAMRHPRRNEINKALGFEAGIDTVPDYIETGESPFLPGDAILLCSDGLTDMISSATITTILNNDKSLAVKAQELIDAANEAGGNDNITAVLVENYNPPKKQVALKPTEKKNGTEHSPHTQKQVVSQQARAAAKNGNRGIIVFLVLLSLGLLIALSVSLIQQKKRIEHNVVTPGVIAKKEKDQQLIQLMAAVNDTVKNYSVPTARTILMDEPMTISKDSFHLFGNGAHLVCDTNYKGPAFIINNSAKYIVLDSLVFENFDAALFMQKNNVVFRNIRFINCKIPIQYAVNVPDSILSGRFKDSIFITNQSLKKR